MNPKLKLKLITDILMTLLLLFLMAYHLWGEAAHEWGGAALFVLFVFHNLLNRNWYQGLGKGRYSAIRLIQTLLNFLLLACMAILMYSGIVLSRYVFSELPVPGRLSSARLLHMASAYWGLVLMALHLGLHWNILLGVMGKMTGGGAEKQKVADKKAAGGRAIAVPGGRLLGLLCGTAIAVYGLNVLIRRDLLTYMLVRTEFVFLDYGESKLWFYIDYLALMGLFVYLAHYGAKLVRKAQGGRKENRRREAGGEKREVKA
ncbi:DUF4405 domain-containing protein [Clostridium sp. MCC353]|uniref:DUF4405 domain-containing protein n=1 Tax=Clostridium sp. MCC353 TaxID=2592646 RepID=UPI001C0143B1|nr:DUF4405 domain-containing protein [Clostridium sp. MCC353]MBT9779650.1 DUF4405 domain-containing protein [Clostridium sp. MCC353]